MENQQYQFLIINIYIKKQIKWPAFQYNSMVAGYLRGRLIP